MKMMRIVDFADPAGAILNCYFQSVTNVHKNSALTSLNIKMNKCCDEKNHFFVMRRSVLSKGKFQYKYVYD